MAQNQRPEIELNPDVRKCLNIWRIVIFVTYFIPIGVLIYVWLKYGIEHYQIHAVVWLIGRIVSRLILIIGNFYMPPYPICLRILNELQFFFEFCWVIFGVVCMIEALSYRGPFWTLIFLVNIIDMSCCSTYSTYAGNKEKRMRAEQEQKQPERKEINVANPEIRIHRVYDDCTICTEKFKDNETVKDLPCRHIFHPACIDKWFEEHKDCPNCKSAIV